MTKSDPLFNNTKIKCKVTNRDFFPFETDVSIILSRKNPRFILQNVSYKLVDPFGPTEVVVYQEKLVIEFKHHTEDFFFLFSTHATLNLVLEFLSNYNARYGDKFFIECDDKPATENTSSASSTREDYADEKYNMYPVGETTDCNYSLLQTLHIDSDQTENKTGELAIQKVTSNCGTSNNCISVMVEERSDSENEIPRAESQPTENDKLNINKNIIEESIQIDRITTGVDDACESDSKECIKPHRVPLISPTYFLIEVLGYRMFHDHVEYEIHYRTNLEHYKLKENTFYRRFDEFCWIHSMLKSELKNKVIMPRRPSKSIVNHNDLSFLNSRVQELDEWLKCITREKLVLNSKNFWEFLNPQLRTIQKKPVIFSWMRHNLQEYPFLKKIERATQDLIYGDKIEPNIYNPVEIDYSDIRALMKYYNLVPKKLPFFKFVTLILGSTSSGKSSFCNNYFGVQVCKTSDQRQDTEYSIVEVINYKEFWELNSNFERVVHESQRFFFKNSTELHGSRPIRFVNSNYLNRAMVDPDTDERLGKAFMFLNSTQTLARYEQLRLFSKHGLFRSCLINSAILDANNPHFDMIQKTIIIDTPGFTSIKETEIEDKFVANLKIFKNLYNMADQLLYFIPSGQISNLTGQLSLLEMIFIYAQEGDQIGDEKVKSFCHQEKSKNNMYWSGLVKCLMERVCVVKERSMLLKGSSVWNKVIFVLSRADILYRQAKLPENWTKILCGQYYELGVALGSTLELGSPISDNCLVIALPEYQEEGTCFTGDLKALKLKIESKSNETTYLERLDDAIQNMCHDLKNLGLNFYSWSAGKKVDEIAARSIQRLKQYRK